MFENGIRRSLGTGERVEVSKLRGKSVAVHGTDGVGVERIGIVE